MRKIIPALLFITFFFATKLTAQDSTATLETELQRPNQKPLLYNYTSKSINNLFNEEWRAGANNRVSIEFDYLANSNSVPAGIVFGMIFKSSISNAVKDRASKRMGNGMVFEDYMKTGISYQRYLKKWDGVFYLSHFHREMRILNSEKETFQLLFYGNAMFENDTVDMSNILFQNYIYSQTSGGIKKKIDYGKYQMQFGVGLSFIQVINNQDIRTKNTWLYTAPDGEYIDVNYDLTFNNAKEGATNFGQLNGIGGSGDLNLGFMNKDKWKLTFDIADIGFIAFRKNPVNYTGTKTVHFTGIVLPNLLEFSSQTFDTLNIDSAARSYLPTRGDNDYSLFMPFTASVVFSKPLLRNKLVLSAGLQYRHMPKYNAYGYLKANYFIKPDMVVSMSAGGGGYSLFNLGLEFSKSWKYFDFALGSANLIGLFAPNHFTGTGLYLRLASSF